MKIELHLKDEEIYYLLAFGKDWTFEVKARNEVWKEEVRQVGEYILDQIKRQWESKRR